DCSGRAAMHAERLHRRHRGQQALALAAVFAWQEQAGEFVFDQCLDGFPGIALLPVEFFRKRPEALAPEAFGQGLPFGGGLVELGGPDDCHFGISSGGTVLVRVARCLHRRASGRARPARPWGKKARIVTSTLPSTILST